MTNPKYNPFYTEALPCESCGTPTYQERQWNPEHELWVAVDCSCNTPTEPLSACLIAVFESAHTVGELLDSAQQHRQTCPVCSKSNVVEFSTRSTLPEAA